MAKINSETLLRGDIVCSIKNVATNNYDNLALPNHLQLSLFVPLPLPAPGSTHDTCHHRLNFGIIPCRELLSIKTQWKIFKHIHTLVIN